MPISDLDRPHLVPKDTRTREGFTAHGGGESREVPALERHTHARSLREQLALVTSAQNRLVAKQRAVAAQTAIGIQVEFLSQQGVEMAAASLARDNQGIELMNVRHQDNQIMATVFVPQGKLRHFETLLTHYAEYKTDRNGRPRDNQALIDAIQSVRVATFQSIWTDHSDALPENDGETIWWEAWLPTSNQREQRIADFRRLAETAGLNLSERILYFPERTVVQIHGSKGQLLRSPLVINMIAELRRAKTTADFFMGEPPNIQAEWSANLERRLNATPIGDAYVTLLDTGVNHGHPLLAPMVADADRHSVEPSWGADDENGHGTELAGLSLLGNLVSALEGNHVVNVPHRLESVKILRWPGDNEGESYGAITAEAVGRVEISDPMRQRVFTMAVSSTDGRDRGRPSSWSAEIDRLASDYGMQGETPRLFVLCAGNTMDSAAWAEYPESLYTNAVHDPGQSWNALTVGAYTELTTITEDGLQHFQAIAPANGLSPYTTTSSTWNSDWPFKPDIVMEGGNAGIDAAANFTSTFDSLSLLTTNYRPHEQPFAISWATSAATALAAGMAARIMAAYPSFWSETVRAVIVHSARWTQPMRDAYTPNGEITRDNLKQLLRHCGYGVPNLERALYSSGNSLTMIVQDQLQPFHKANGSIRTCEMHLHNLPWPIDILEALGDAPVTLRVTLSYFIEPNPGDRGGIDKYAYQSHSLRFEVKRPLENEATFRSRINAQASEEEQGLRTNGGGDPNWFIGKRLRARGSLLSDSWTGTAAELASRGQLAVYPAMGWWRNRPVHERYNRVARYALIVSIEAPTVEQDLYANIQQQIAVQQSIETLV